MIRLLCNHCLVPADDLYCLGHSSVRNGSVYENDYGEADTHLHHAFPVPWWNATEEARKNAEEVPF